MFIATSKAGLLVFTKYGWVTLSKAVEIFADLINIGPNFNPNTPYT